ncbi:MAG: DUF4412 domain-containing protein [Bacteroidota bacterium]
MKAFFFFIFCLCLLPYNAQVLNQVGSSIKNGATTKAADFNRTRSNKEKNDLDKNATPKSSVSEDVEEINAETSPSPEERTGERIDATYTFTYLLSYQTISYGGGLEGDRKEMIYYFGDSTTLFTTDGPLLLNDARNKRTLILNEESKTGFSTPYQEISSAEAIGDMNREIYAYKKTGNTKEILGYPCEEYILMRENKKLSTLWSAQENPLVKNKLNTKFMTDQMIMGINSLNPNPDGMVLEFNQYDDEEQLLNTIRMNAFESTEKVIQLMEYQITSY